MIKSFQSKETQKIFERNYSHRIPRSIQKTAMRKLWMIDAATILNDLRMPPSNHLEKLQGKRKKQHSIRINKQWRICFLLNITNMANKKIQPIHPGEILKEEFLDPLNITQYRLAKDISVSPRRINEIVHGTRAITADTALRLGRYFGVSPQFWLNLQSRYELEIQTEELSNRLQNEVKVLQHAV